ncbi:vinorine synthase-like isoform X2 [Prunus avium]|uniref:Vinorine synthase-like isoform X2 n=1 Tax=Prunus avium TaxID=42229 RepID=A0A6P5U0F2_PRUAV|nr:vinorine synthase-like isoform X2 [Prunus avium]
MKIEVEVITKETIKPSSPTPHHLHHHQLSFLDQLAPHAYVPFLYFYEFNSSTNITQISNLLKTSLSKVLIQYYPFAGRVRNNLFVHCKDQGIPFSEVQVKTHLLSDVITNPCLSELHKLLPFKLDEVTETALGVQLNVFECGGIAVGLCISHRIADARSCFTFVNNWAAASNCGQGNKNSIVGPDFSAASIFPPRNMDGYLGVPITNRHEIKTKKFVFDVSKVEALRSKYEQSIKISKTQKRPSKVEALSAFLWDIFVLSRPRERPQTLYAVVYIMDLRSRFKPPLPHHTFGNYYRAAMAAPALPTSEKHHGSVRQVIEEIEKIDSNYMRKFQEGYQEHLDFMKKRTEKAAKGELVTFTFSSVCKFPVYDADFGWGRPTWVSMTAMRISNQIVFMDTRNGDGIESYFSLKEEDMVKFEHNKEFTALLSSPIAGGAIEMSFSGIIDTALNRGTTTLSSPIPEAVAAQVLMNVVNVAASAILWERHMPIAIAPHLK